MENPNLKWMISRGTPISPPNLSFGCNFSASCEALQTLMHHDLHGTLQNAEFFKHLGTKVSPTAALRQLNLFFCGKLSSINVPQGASAKIEDGLRKCCMKALQMITSMYIYIYDCGLAPTKTRINVGIIAMWAGWVSRQKW